MSQANSEEESEPTVQIILAGEKPNEFKTYDYKTALAKALEEHKEFKRNQFTRPKNKNTEKIHFKCDYCDYTSLREQSLNLHIRKHNEEFQQNQFIRPKNKNTEKIHFKCDYCDYTALRKQSLNLHIRKHMGDSPYVCDVCGHKSVHVRCHKLHEATHSGRNIFECNFCMYKTIYSYSYKIHMRRHSINFQIIESSDCQLCVYKAVDRHDLRFHMLRVHTDPKKVFDCPLCKYASTRPSKLKRHLNTHGANATPDYCDSCITQSSTDTESILPE